jgi:adenylate kinase family enzyme
MPSLGLLFAQAILRRPATIINPMGEPAAAQQIRGYQRINVVGMPGSGKTTFARELGQRLGLPCVEMDALFWQPGWRESSNEEFFPRVEQAISGERWVLDGNYSKTIPIKWKRVQLVVWLDPPFLRTIARVAARTIRRGLTREELWPGTGNRESLLQAFFSRKSIIWLAIRIYARNREKYRALMAAPEYSQIRFVRLASPAEAALFLRRLI